MENKKSRGVIIFIIFLILCIAGLVSYILIDKDIIKLSNSNKENNQINITEDKQEAEDDKGISIDITNENVITLYNNAHQSKTQIYKEGGYKVSEMSEEDKFTLLATQWHPLMEQKSSSNPDNPNWTLYLDEDTLKNIYERTFGPNTYHQVNQITDGVCTTLTYDATQKRYSYVGKYGCGGYSAFSAHEKIIKATKYSDRIEIISAVVYSDAMSDQMYKDYNKTTSLGGLLPDENSYDKYIEDNKDNLEQYTYTYTLNKDGFYYLDSVKRTKS